MFTSYFSFLPGTQPVDFLEPTLFGVLIKVKDDFIQERPIFVREKANGYYAVSTYFLSKVLTDMIPLRLFLPAVLSTVIYWMIGYSTDFIRFIKYLIVCVEVNVVSAAFMYMLSCLFSSHAAATYVGALIMLGMLLFGGLLLNLSTVTWALQWLRYLSFFSFAFESLLTNDLNGLTIHVDLASLQNPINLSGNLFLEAFGLQIGTFWMNVAVLFGMTVAYTIIAFLFMYWCIYYKQ